MEKELISIIELESEMKKCFHMQMDFGRLYRLLGNRFTILNDEYILVQVKEGYCLLSYHTDAYSDERGAFVEKETNSNSVRLINEEDSLVLSGIFKQKQEELSLIEKAINKKK